MKGSKTQNTKEKIKCKKCGELKSPTLNNFYTNSNPLFSTEKLEICKDCIFKFLGDKNSSDYLHRVYLVLSLLDKPFIVDKWSECNGEWSKYIPQISTLKQHKGQTFKDSDFGATQSDLELIHSEGVDHNESIKVYSSKWMGEYTRNEIEYLENYYSGLDRDFKIVTTNHKDYAKKICKASLHMDKCFQEVLNGVSGADKRYKDAKEVFDTLSKSAQFSESQRGQNDVSLGCFGVTFDQVEQRKWIPKHYSMSPDDFDKIINQFSTIEKSI